MVRSFCKWLLYKRWGWKTYVTQPHPEKYIICLAPHTSNWDFVIGMLYSRAEGIKCNFLMKKEWFVWPLGSIFRKLGGIPVWRSKHCNMTDNLAHEAQRAKVFHLCITPEGTRSATADWRKGFYYIATKSNIPILLYGLDYKSKLIECTHTIVANGKIDEQMCEIKHYYKRFNGLKPENFTIVAV